MTSDLRNPLRWQRARTAAQLALALGVAMLVVIPGVGLLLALAAAVILLLARRIARTGATRPRSEGYS
jgi:uncharacterized protein (DUF2062 family)